MAKLPRNSAVDYSATLLNAKFNRGAAKTALASLMRKDII
jgi:hypothetical protein